MPFPTQQRINHFIPPKKQLQILLAYPFFDRMKARHKPDVHDNATSCDQVGKKKQFIFLVSFECKMTVLTTAKNFWVNIEFSRCAIQAFH